MTLCPTTPVPTGERRSSDDGFSLVEVIVALLLLVSLMAAVLPFFLGAVATTANLQRRQAGVAAASAALEQASAAAVRSQDLGGGTVVTGVVEGRSSTAVSTQWGASTHPEEAATYQRSDPTASSPPLVPLSVTDTVVGTRYTTQVLIGTCYQARATPTASCGLRGASPPAIPPAGDVEMVRVMVETRWQRPKDSSCRSGECVYRMSTLLDPNSDPTWSRQTVEARDDQALAVRGQTASIRVLANDPVTVSGASPVALVAPVPQFASVASDGTVLYAAPANAPLGSTVEIRYTARSAAGPRTGQALVTLTVVSG